MAETWLATNRRVWALGMALPAVVAAVGLGLFLAAGPHAGFKILGAALLAGSVLIAFLLVRQMAQPRLAYRDGKLLVNLRSGAPIEVPIDNVECFFHGQVSARFRTGGGAPTDVSTVVVRLADAATDFRQREVKPALGRWCDGYITLHGIWCEPLSAELVRGLNHRLRKLRHGQSSKHREPASADRASRQPAVSAPRAKPLV